MYPLQATSPVFMTGMAALPEVHGRIRFRKMGVVTNSLHAT